MKITDEIKIGGHVSTSGGIYMATERASKFAFKTFQIFSKNQMQWKAKPLDAEDVKKFRKAVKHFGFSGTMVHASYLLNMGTPDLDLRKKVLDAFSLEIERADILGLDFLTFHPGSASGTTKENALRNIAENLNTVMRDNQHCTILLENAAGQGNTVGDDFHQLASIIDDIQIKDRIGICLDTCHTWAAGYDIVSPEGYAETIDEFASLIGLERLKGIHLNDSKKGRGSHLDRHEQIGLGTIGISGIRNIVMDRRLREVPMILETPLGEEGYQQDIDAINSIGGNGH